MKKIIYLSLLLTPLLFCDQESERTYIEPQTLLDYRIFSEQKTACSIQKNINKVCFEEKIEYPNISTIKNKEIVTLIKNDIDKMLQTFQKKQLQDEIKEEVYDENSFNLYEHIAYNIFSFTPKTLTIEESFSTYGGGAHGNYSTSYKNIDKNTKKEIKLKDIIKPNQKNNFKNFTESFYRKQHHLSNNTPLKEAGWFDNKFTLAENFAITPQGLYFLYNSYEIQPYVMGQEVILLPYHKIKEFLSPKYFDDVSLKAMDKLAHTYIKTFDNTLKVNVTATGEHTIKIIAEATNSIYNTTQGWLSISVKELKGKEAKVTLLHKDFDDFNSYKAGSKIYSKKEKKAIKSQYLLVESSSKKWKSNEKKKLEFELEVPKEIKHLTVLLRVVHKFNGRIIEPEINEELEQTLVKGQQGHNNFILNIDL